MLGFVLALLLGAQSPDREAAALSVAAPPRLALELALEIPRLSLEGLALGETDSSKVSTAESPQGPGWMVAGTIGGVPVGALALGIVGLALGSTRDPPSIYEVHNGALAGYYIGAGVGAVLGGVGGYFLGKLARHGSVAAKIGVVALDVLGLPALCVDALLPLSFSISAGG